MKEDKVGLCFSRGIPVLLQNIIHLFWLSFVTRHFFIITFYTILKLFLKHPNMSREVGDVVALGIVLAIMQFGTTLQCIIYPIMRPYSNINLIPIYTHIERWVSVRM